MATSSSSKVISGKPRSTSFLGVKRDVKASFGEILAMTRST